MRKHKDFEVLPLARNRYGVNLQGRATELGPHLVLSGPGGLGSIGPSVAKGTCIMEPNTTPSNTPHTPKTRTDYGLIKGLSRACLGLILGGGCIWLRVVLSSINTRNLGWGSHTSAWFGV